MGQVVGAGQLHLRAVSRANMFKLSMLGARQSHLSLNKLNLLKLTISSTTAVRFYSDNLKFGLSSGNPTAETNKKTISCCQITNIFVFSD